MSLSSPFRHALPVSEFLFHEPIYLTHAGWERIAPGEPYPQRDAPLFFFEWREGRTLPEFCLAMVLKGAGELQTRRYARRVEAGDVFLFAPGEWHRHRPVAATGWELMWIHFNGDSPWSWERSNSFCVDRSIAQIENTTAFRNQFVSLLEMVHRNPATNSPNWGLLAGGLLAHLLADRTSCGERRVSVDDERILAAVEYIWNFSHDVLDVPTVANRVGLPRRTLDRRFKEATGRSVLEEIQFCRVSRAAKLLEGTHMPIKQIVHRAGFRSGEHLRLAFQNAFGNSPLEFRKRKTSRNKPPPA